MIYIFKLILASGYWNVIARNLWNEKHPSRYTFLIVSSLHIYAQTVPSPSAFSSVLFPAVTDFFESVWVIYKNISWLLHICSKALASLKHLLLLFLALTPTCATKGSCVPKEFWRIEFGVFSAMKQEHLGFWKHSCLKCPSLYSSDIRHLSVQNAKQKHNSLTFLVYIFPPESLLSS